MLRPPGPQPEEGCDGQVLPLQRAAIRTTMPVQPCGLLLPARVFLWSRRFQRGRAGLRPRKRSCEATAHRPRGLHGDSASASAGPWVLGVGSALLARIRQTLETLDQYFADPSRVRKRSARSGPPRPPSAGRWPPTSAAARCAGLDGSMKPHG